MFGLTESPQQFQAVTAFLEGAAPNLAINAVAGSGKTHTLVILNRGLIERGESPDSILNLSFAKRDAVAFQPGEALREVVQHQVLQRGIAVGYHLVQLRLAAERPDDPAG